MAQNKQRQRREFFAQHPMCIFCAGVAPATTLDHVPSRRMFHQKNWPEGYVFPSCKRCNQETKDAEQVMALISRMAPDAKTEKERLEVLTLAKAISNNYPGVLKEMRATSEQTAEYRSKPWLPTLIKAGLAAHEPLSVRGPLVNKFAGMLARKLFTALHYKEFGKIIPREGGILWRWYTNAQRLDDALPYDLIETLRQRPGPIERARRNLSDQFSYHFEKVVDGELTGYFVTFRRSFAMLGFVDMNATELQSGLRAPLAILRPIGVDASGTDVAA